MGRSSLANISSCSRLVTGTSAVGFNQRSSRSHQYMSSFILGYWPVPMTAARLTTTGGKTSV